MNDSGPVPIHEILETVARYYADRLRQFGPTARGVDWNSSESQALRLSQLLTIADAGEVMSIVDFGCGYGALVERLRAWGAQVSYQGFDVSGEMIDAARARHAGVTWCTFTSDQAALRRADFAIASGIFNVKLGYDPPVWREYVEQTLQALDALSVRGFAFNMLSTYSDADKRRDDLYYANPLDVFDLCKRRFSSRVALLHDYPLYEFTILVRK